MTSSAKLTKLQLAAQACLGVKTNGKLCAGNSLARFDEGGQAQACSLLFDQRTGNDLFAFKPGFALFPERI